MGAVKMDWALFWFVALCFVGTLIALQNFQRLAGWVRGAWGAARGFYARISGVNVHKVDITPAPATGHIRPTKPDSGTYMAHKPVSAQPSVHLPPLNAIKSQKTGFNALALASFIWRRPLPLLFVAGFVVIALTFSGCVPDWGKSKDELRLERELAQAEAETQAAINARDAVIAQAAQDAALSRERIQQASQRGRDAIAAATPENEAPLDPELVRAWRFALDELCVLRADGSRADSCGPGAAPAV